MPETSCSPARFCHACVVPSFGLDLADWFTKHADKVESHLKRYFGGGKEKFTGRWFDEFAAIGDPNRFEASDVLAVEALSVEVPSEAASILLITESERFNGLLRQIPREQDLWEVSRLAVNVGGPADDLHNELRTLPRVDWVTAGKLMQHAADTPGMKPGHRSTSMRTSYTDSGGALDSCSTLIDTNAGMTRNLLQPSATAQIWHLGTNA